MAVEKDREKKNIKTVILSFWTFSIDYIMYNIHMGHKNLDSSPFGAITHDLIGLMVSWPGLRTKCVFSAQIIVKVKYKNYP